MNGTHLGLGLAEGIGGVSIIRDEEEEKGWLMAREILGRRKFMTISGS